MFKEPLLALRPSGVPYMNKASNARRKNGAAGGANGARDVPSVLSPGSVLAPPMAGKGPRRSKHTSAISAGERLGTACFGGGTGELTVQHRGGEGQCLQGSAPPRVGGYKSRPRLWGGGKRAR